MIKESNRRNIAPALRATKRLNFIGRITTQYANNKIKIACNKLTKSQVARINKRTFRYINQIDAGLNMSLRIYYDIAIALNIDVCELIPPLHTIKLAIYKNKL